MRVQYRLHAGDDTKFEPFNIDALQGATSALLSVVGSCVQGTVSNDGGVSYPEWSSQQCFDAPLAPQGVAVSARGGVGTKFVFDLSRFSPSGSNVGTHAVTPATFANVSPVSDGAEVVSYGAYGY